MKNDVVVIYRILPYFLTGLIFNSCSPVEKNIDETSTELRSSVREICKSKANTKVDGNIVFHLHRGFVFIGKMDGLDQKSYIDVKLDCLDETKKEQFQKKYDVIDPRTEIFSDYAIYINEESNFEHVCDSYTGFCNFSKKEGTIYVIR